MELKVIFENRKDKGTIPTINKVLFAVLFILLRTVYSFTFVQMISYSDHFFLVRLAIAMIQSMNCVWGWKILNLFIKGLYELYPNNTPVKKIYLFLKALRNYGLVVNIISFIVCTGGLWLKKLGR